MAFHQLAVLLCITITHFVFKTETAIVNSGVSDRNSFVNGIKYPGCDGTVHMINAAEGVITSPGYPAPYPHDITCKYKIIVNEGQKLRLLYTFMAIQEKQADTSSCSDSVHIYGDSTASSSLIAQHCQLLTPGDVYVTDGHIAHVVFESDATISSLGFVLTFQSVSNTTRSIFTSTTLLPPTSALAEIDYTSVSTFNSMTTAAFDAGTCVSSEFYELTESSGILESPNYPASYPADSNCRWKLTADQGQYIKLRIKTFHTEESEGCVHDYLRIDDKKYIDEKICGSWSAETIYSSSSNVYLTFNSDESIEGDGFTIEYETVSLCQSPMVLRSSSGMLGTPGYMFNGKGRYADNTACSWKFIADTDQTIRLTIIKLDLEDMSETGSCAYDSVHIYDGSSNSDTKLRTLCGTGNNYLRIQSTGRYMYMTFTSDSDTAANGFEFSWIFQSTITSPKPTNQTQGDPCDGTYAYVELPGTSGTVTSPNYPSPYPSNSRCSWKIVGSNAQNIVLRIKTLDMERANQQEFCWFDFLKLKRAKSTSSTIATYCGLFVKPQNIYFESSEVYIEFKSDSDNSEVGFLIDYEKINLCQNPMTITEPAGRLGTPGFFWDGSGSYENNLNCEWLFQAGNDEVVVIKKHQVDIESGVLSPCDADVLSIYDGTSSSSPLLQRICEKGHVDLQHKSSGSNMYMRFTSDIAIHYNGFEFSWEFKDKADNDTFVTSHADGCDGGTFKLTADSGSIASPLTASGKYPTGVTCRYSVTVSANSDATLAFSKFALEDDPSCSNDWVKVYDGTSNTGALLGTYCGIQAPAAITSTTHTFHIEFHSDSTVTDTGFTAMFGTKNEVDLNVCGITHIDPSRPADTKIVGGEEAVAHSHPWMALIWINDGESIMVHCGGSIIDDQWILTAAHCTEDRIATNFIITLGDHDQIRTDEASQTVYSVREIIEHPSYNTNTIDNDIALLKLNTSVTYNFGRKKVCIPGSDVAEGITCWIAGWGETEGTADNKYRLNQAKVVTISRSTCTSSEFLSHHVTDNMFCAGFAEGGVDTCQGDSGGPLVCEDNGVYTQYGIVSFGFGCAEKQRPGVYTRLHNYIDWINQNIGP